MTSVDALDVCGNCLCPRKRSDDFIARLPGEDGFVLFIRYAGDRIRTVENKLDRRFEVGDQLAVGPERSLRLPPKRLVLTRSPPPEPIVDERNDQSDPYFVRDLKHLVKCPERLLVEFAGSLDMKYGDRVAFFSDREDVDACNFAPHLFDRHQRIANLKFIRQTPWVGPSEREIIFDVMKVRNIARDEAKLIVAVHQFVSLDRNEVFELGIQEEGANEQKGQGLEDFFHNLRRVCLWDCSFSKPKWQM